MIRRTTLSQQCIFNNPVNGDRTCCNTNICFWHEQCLDHHSPGESTLCFTTRKKPRRQFSRIESDKLSQRESIQSLDVQSTEDIDEHGDISENWHFNESMLPEILEFKFDSVQPTLQPLSLDENMDESFYQKMIMQDLDANFRMHPNLPGTVVMRNLIATCNEAASAIYGTSFGDVSLSKYKFVHLQFFMGEFDDGEHPYAVCAECPAGIRGATVALNGPLGSSTGYFICNEFI